MKDRRLAFTCLSFVLALAAGASSGSDAQAPAIPSTATKPVPAIETDVTFDTLTIDLANARKSLADETFLLAKDLQARKQALSMYQKAFDDTCVFDSWKVPQAQQASATAVMNLLREDIKYRALLLTAGYSFWGGLYDQKVLIPSNELARFNKLVDGPRAAEAKRMATRPNKHDDLSNAA